MEEDTSGSMPVTRSPSSARPRDPSWSLFRQSDRPSILSSSSCDVEPWTQAGFSVRHTSQDGPRRVNCGSGGDAKWGRRKRMTLTQDMAMGGEISPGRSRKSAP